jgi:hypothetical protein
MYEYIIDSSALVPLFVAATAIVSATVVAIWLRARRRR